MGVNGQRIRINGLLEVSRRLILDRQFYFRRNVRAQASKEQKAVNAISDMRKRAKISSWEKIHFLDMLANNGLH